MSAHRSAGIEAGAYCSVDPNEIDDELIELVAESPKVCRHLHIPLQSGSDQILEKMRRRYRTSDFRHIVNAVRKHVPEIAVTTDVIVGFPGETPELFAETHAFLTEMQLAKLHVFKYSPRAGTPAAGYPDQVSSQEKEKRSRALIALSDQMSERYQSRFVGKTVQVLVEREINGRLYGHTDNYIHVSFPVGDQDSTDLIGRIVDVRIEEVIEDHSAGILL